MGSEMCIRDRNAEIYTLQKGMSVYVAKGTEAVPAGMYLAGDKGYTAYDGEDSNLIEITDELITWSKKYDKETKVYVLEDEVKEIAQPEYEYTEEKKDVSSEVEFVPDTSEGSVKVEFIFDGSELAGETLVVFEELYLNGKLIAEHKDLEDEAQTVYLPKIQTEATDTETGTHTVIVLSLIHI